MVHCQSMVHSQATCEPKFVRPYDCRPLTNAYEHTVPLHCTAIPTILLPAWGGTLDWRMHQKKLDTRCHCTKNHPDGMWAAHLQAP